MINKFKHLKIQTKLFLLILVTGFLCLILFRFLWLKRLEVWYVLSHDLSLNLPFVQRPDDDIWTKFDTEARNYNFPDSEDDKEGQEEIKPYLAMADDYTGLYIYGLYDGLYRAGHYPKILEQENSFASLFQMGFYFTGGSGEQVIDRPVKFKNGYASVMLVFYHASCFTIPYFIFCLFVCITLFLFTILFFVSRKLKTVSRLKQHILQMSSGDLETPVFDAGEDEVGILAQELDMLRCTLHDNILHEQKIHKSNQELIAALSHDLRTPLTIIKGYLEIIKLNQNKDMQTEYISRCIQKTEDIKELTDRMFEYALVYDETTLQAADINLENLPCSFFLNSLTEHADFLRLAGFSAELHVFDIPKEPVFISADEAMVKRVLNNLFSNILKYADKKEAVVISASLDTSLNISLKNGVKPKHDNIESTQIGLKSIRKIMKLMDGSFSLKTDDIAFIAVLEFCISTDVRQ